MTSRSKARKCSRVLRNIPHFLLSYANTHETSLASSKNQKNIFREGSPTTVMQLNSLLDTATSQLNVDRSHAVHALILLDRAPPESVTPHTIRLLYTASLLVAVKTSDERKCDYSPWAEAIKVSLATLRQMETAFLEMIRHKVSFDPDLYHVYARAFQGTPIPPAPAVVVSRDEVKEPAANSPFLPNVDSKLNVAT